MEPKRWDMIEEERIGPDVVRKMFWGENIMVTRWELAPGTVLPIHDHVSEQVTIVERGSVTLKFPDAKEVNLQAGDMLVIPPSLSHGVTVGPEGCTAMDLFSPIRQDFIEKGSSLSPGQEDVEKAAQTDRSSEEQERDKYIRLRGFLTAAGIEIPLERLQELPLVILARYVYERECVTMGQLREVLGLDKKQAKDLLRKWKHGDDHSESSLKRKMERLIVFPWEQH